MPAREARPDEDSEWEYDEEVERPLFAWRTRALFGAFGLVLAFQLLGAPALLKTALNSILAQEATVLLGALLVLASGRSAVWLLVTFAVSSVQWGLALYQLFRILIAMVATTLVRVVGWLMSMSEIVACYNRRSGKLSRRLAAATSLQDYRRIRNKIESLEAGKLSQREQQQEDEVLRQQQKNSNLAHPTNSKSIPATSVTTVGGSLGVGDIASVGRAESMKYGVAMQHVTESLERLQRCRDAEDGPGMMMCLQSMIKRDFHGIDTPDVHLSRGAGAPNLLKLRKEVERYDANVVDALHYLADLTPEQLGLAGSKDKQRFFERARRHMGKSALCLSGGGSLAMYHFGVVQAMLETNTLPRVISGSSGGSIVAGSLAVRRDDEMKELFREDVAIMYKSEGIVWFPDISQQIAHFLEKNVLVNRDDFIRCTKRYFGDLTFEEGFARTGRVVNISVTVSGSASSSGKILLNYISTPSVYVWSAVATSCALPGIMEPIKLMAKGPDGKPMPFMSDGINMIDGSLMADLPMLRLAELFGISNFIVSQVNPYVSPLMRKTWSPSTDRLWSIEKFLQMDVRYRFQVLAKLGLIPRLFGQNVNGVFKQKYSGRVTILPEISLLDNFKAIMNPTRADMRRYLGNGQRAYWPVADFTQHLLAVEQALDTIVFKLRKAPPSPAEISSSENSATTVPTNIKRKPSLSYLVLPKMQEEGEGDDKQDENIRSPATVNSASEEPTMVTSPTSEYENDLDQVPEMSPPRPVFGQSNNSLSSLFNHEEEVIEEEEGVVIAPEGWESKEGYYSGNDKHTPLGRPLVRSSSIAEALVELTTMRKTVSKLRRENNKLRMHVRRLEAEANEDGDSIPGRPMPSSMSMLNFTRHDSGGGGFVAAARDEALRARGRAKSQTLVARKHSPLQNQMYTGVPKSGVAPASESLGNSCSVRRPMMHRRESSGGAPLF